MSRRMTLLLSLFVLPLTLAASADDLGLSFKFMPSGAGHDAQDMANGTSVLLRTVLEIDGGALE
jgi:hypothetical protein